MLRNTKKRFNKSFNSLVPFFETVVENSQMLVGLGNAIDFWCDNWSGMGSLILKATIAPNVFPKLSELLHDGHWELDTIQQSLDSTTLQEIYSNTPRLSSKDDRLVWKHTTDGSFSIKTAWHLVRTPGNINAITEVIWKQKVPPSS